MGLFGVFLLLFFVCFILDLQLFFLFTFIILNVIHHFEMLIFLDDNFII